jgi:coenzyme PQQ precursor peptide PqqA
VKSFAAQHKQTDRLKISGELFDPQYLSPQGRKFVRHQRESQMAWKAPKIVEVSVGMEINMYMCATRK